METGLITNNSINRRLLKPMEAADILAISRATLYRMVDRREIFAHKVGGSLRFSKEDIDDYLEGTRIKPINTYCYVYIQEWN
jgi:excisionase family DNA binding protein